MAEMSLEQIEAVVRSRGDYQNTRKFPSEGPEGVRAEIQRAFGEFWALIAKTHQGYWDTQTTLATVSAQAYVELPRDVWSLQALDRAEGSEWRELSQVTIADRNRFGVSGKPCAFRPTARGIDLYPTPDAAYTLRLLYTPRAPLLSVSGQREWFNGWEDFVITAALIKLATRDKSPMLKTHMDALYGPEGIKARITGEASERKQQEPEYLRLREPFDLDPNGWNGDY